MFFFRSVWFWFSSVMLLAVAMVGFTPRTTAQDLDPREIRRAIDEGIQFLKRQQQPLGNWAEYPGETVGTTALVVLAMRSCGVDKDDPAIQRAMTYLRAHQGRAGKNYSVSLQTMAFCVVEPERDRILIRENVAYLEKTQVRVNNEHNGGWHYTPSGHSDLSNSQFSVLALYEAERVGVSVNKDTWERTRQYWAHTQNKNGSWNYTPSAKGGCTDQGGRGSLTCAGIASLIISSGILGNDGAVVRGENIICSQPPNHHFAAKIKGGLDWLARGFTVSENPNFKGHYLYYYLYALERAGRLTNRRFIGDHDWYREGADKLLESRVNDPVDGSWRGAGVESKLVATSFALLFLSKGRRPVLMSKVEYGFDHSWNAHPNDANHLTMFAESRWKIDLTWQMLKIDAATTDDLAQTPVLYFCGNRSPLPDNEGDASKLAAKLRDYLDRGGFILAEAQPDDRSFHSGFRELMKRVLPEPGYDLALLENSHPIWSAEIPIEPNQLRPIEGISFGCRTSVVYVPPDKSSAKSGKQKPSLSCLWEVARIFKRDENYPASVQRQIDAALGIGLNILAYATNRELKYKDEISATATRKVPDTWQRRGRVFVSLLNHSGGANSAPRAAPNLLRWLETNLGIPVDLHNELVDPGDDHLYEYPLLLMHGRGVFQFSQQQRDRLKKHLESGGFLFANAICSNKVFGDSFRAEIEKMFPENPLERIAMDDPLFSDTYGGSKIRTLELRIPELSPERRLTTPTRQVEPELYGLRHEDRWIAVFSPNDVSCSLERANSIECRGYTPSSAMQLAVNVLLYSLEHW